MKRLTFALLALSIATAAFAADDPQPQPAEKPAPPLGARADKLIHDAMPSCSEPATESRVALQHKLPSNLVGAIVRRASNRSMCEGQWVALLSNEGNFYFGTPWFLDDGDGTIEQKLRSFTQQYMHAIYEPVVDRSSKTKEGFYRATLYQPLDGGGKLPLEGEVDQAGTFFVIGHFMPLTGDVRAARLKALDRYLAASPATGSAKPVVTVVEFSDFECPSCKHAAGYLKPILAAHSDRVRYVRYDTPLAMIHPWALAAAVAGRAIWRQKPDLFWAYKEQIYDNQDNLTAFTIDQFARGFAQDHELDLQKYDADVASAEIRKDLIDGVGTAFSNGVAATPTYIVNGAIIDPGNEGKTLASYVESLLKK